MYTDLEIKEIMGNIETSEELELFAEITQYFKHCFPLTQLRWIASRVHARRLRYL